MINLFFSSTKTIEEVSNYIFKSLGINNYLEGDSVNVLGGYYNSFSVFGVNIKLELNSYDYEDEYQFMIRVYKDLVSDIKVDFVTIKMVSDIIIKVLTDNTDIQVIIRP